MSIALTSPVTGSTVSGLTSPTYTVSADTAPNAFSKQWAVTAIGGTQTGVDSGTSASRPWTIMAYRPQNIRALQSVDTNNVLRVVPFNSYGILVRKGLTPLAGQASRTAQFRAEFAMPAGADVADQANVKAAISSFIGVLNQQSSGIADTLVTGVL